MLVCVAQARVLQMESQMRQYSELHSALFRGLFSAAASPSDTCPFLVLKVQQGGGGEGGA